MEDFEKELKLCFLEEAYQSATEVESCFLELENDPDNDQNLNRIFRHVHNLKGSSRAVGFENFAEFTHQFESFILKIKSKELKATKAAVNLLLKGNDQIVLMITGLKSDLAAKFDFSVLLKDMVNFNGTDNSDSSSTSVDSKSAGDVSETSPIESVTSDASLEELVAQVQEPSQEPLSAAAYSPPAAIQQTASPAVSSQATPAKPEVSLPAPKNSTEESIRVSIGKVDALLNTIGEMVILQGVLRETIQETPNTLLRKTVHQLRKVGKEIQDIAMSLRMISVKPTFQKMQRIVRDTSQALGKDVHFELVGEDTEVDKTVLEKINDPLVHLIRNAVDHGIESKENRSSSGKNPKGIVRLSAQNQAGKFVIEIKDDGGGINPEKLKAKAIQKGIIRPEQKLTDKEALQLIFAPGFSTKEQVTDVSGRGVGMDVVRTNINELSGEIIIESVVGSGTTFRIVLPLTLAIIDAMILTYSGNKFVLPLSQVLETVSPSEQMIQKNTDLGEILNLRGENLPLARLGDFFGIKSHSKSDKMIALIVIAGRKKMALLVDDILGQFQVVVKQLTPELQSVKGVSGTTILGDGRPALILETQDLVKRKLTNGYMPPAGGKIDSLQKPQIGEVKGIGSAA